MDVTMDHKWTIDKLPEEVLVEIFCYLDSDDLFEVAKVRVNWKKLINENARIRKKLVLELIFTRPFGTLKRAPDGFDFRYNRVNVLGCKSWVSDALSMMKELGKELRHLYLLDCEFHNSRDIIAEIFSSLAKLEVLQMRRVGRKTKYYDFEGEKFYPAIKLDHLKSVILEDTNSEMLEFIKSSQLTSLTIEEMYAAAMVEFLGTQTMLEELTLYWVDFTLVEATIEEMNFPLKRLVLGFLRNFMGGESNALAFLNKFANTLEHLVLGSKFEISTYALVFEKLQKLQSLELCAYDLPKDENFYKKLPTLPSVKKLIVSNYRIAYQQFVQGIIGNLPNTETLTIDKSTEGNGLMTFVSNNLEKLKSLGISDLSGKPFEDVTMPQSLRKVELAVLVRNLADCSGDEESDCSDDEESLIPDDEWSQMLVAMPNVEQLTIHDLNGRLNEANFDALTRSWTQLRVLNLGANFVPKPQMFNDLLTRCPNIATVRVSGCVADDPAFKDFKKPGLRLIAQRNIKFECLAEEKDPTSLNYY